MSCWERRGPTTSDVVFSRSHTLTAYRARPPREPRCTGMSALGHSETRRGPRGRLGLTLVAARSSSRSSHAVPCLDIARRRQRPPSGSTRHDASFARPLPQNAVRKFRPRSTGDENPRLMITFFLHLTHSITRIATHPRPHRSPGLLRAQPARRPQIPIG